MVKYSILIPFYNRLKEFRLAIESYSYWYGERRDYEVLIGNDAKNKEGKELLALVGAYPNINFRIFKTGTEEGVCPGPAFNFLAGKAIGEVLILTNPETVHLANILDSIENNMWKNGVCRYLVFACEAGYVDDFNQKYPVIYRPYLWYQHSLHNNRKLHFCSAMFKEQYLYLGGFDEDYAKGCDYDDNDLVQRVMAKEIPIETIDSEMVLHIEHDRAYNKSLEKIEINRSLYEKKWGVRLP